MYLVTFYSGENIQPVLVETSEAVEAIVGSGANVMVETEDGSWADAVSGKWVSKLSVNNISEIILSV